jgi:hypothetical protein
MGATLMTVTCAKHLQVPLVPLPILCKFYNHKEGEPEIDLQYSNMIRRWIVECLGKNRWVILFDIIKCNEV